MAAAAAAARCSDWAVAQRRGARQTHTEVLHGLKGRLGYQALQAPDTPRERREQQASSDFPACY